MKLPILTKLFLNISNVLLTFSPVSNCSFNLSAKFNWFSSLRYSPIHFCLVLIFSNIFRIVWLCTLTTHGKLLIMTDMSVCVFPNDGNILIVAFVAASSVY